MPLRELLPNSFIYIDEHALSAIQCAAMIAQFEASTEDHYQGRVGHAAQQNTDVKRSTDMVISGKPEWSGFDQALFASLSAALQQLREQFAFFHGKFRDQGYAIQKTAAGEFFHWHTDSGSHSMADRQLVAIWYLNDVVGPGGETEFKQQQIAVKPATGKLLLFPPFWTHEHRGVTLEKGEKYIATTWLQFA